MNIFVALAVYATAMVLANLSVVAFGPSVTPINAFVLIGLDLALRDWLHVRLRMWQMAALIVGTGAMTYSSTGPPLRACAVRGWCARTDRTSPALRSTPSSSP